MKGQLIKLSERFLTTTSGNQKYAILQFSAFPGQTSWETSWSEHRFNPLFVEELENCVQIVERDASYRALVLTGEGKYFTNGMDVEFIRRNLSEAESVQKRVENLMCRLLKIPLITVALINGHCTAAGAILSLCADYRIMTKRGLFFTPAVDLGIVYSQGFIEVVKAKVPDPTIQRDMLLLSHRYSSDDLMRLGLIHKQVENLEQGFSEVDHICKSHSNYIGASLGEVRARMYERAIHALETDDGSSDMRWKNLVNKSKL